MPQLDLDGVTLNYERSGAGETMLFIQGVGCKGCVWKPQFDAFQSDFDCLLFDNRGIGQSVGGIEDLSIALMAADATQLLDELSIEKAHVVGHSMGGTIAMELALNVPSRVRSLSLVCTFHRGKDATTLSLAMLKHGILTNVGTASMRQRAFARMVSSPSYIETHGIERVVNELQEAFGRNLAKLPTVAWRQLTALSRYDSSSRLHELIATPTMILAGEVDPIARPDFARRLANAVKTEDTHILKNCSHAMTIHSVNEVNDLLRNHANRFARSSLGGTC